MSVGYRIDEGKARLLREQAYEEWLKRLYEQGPSWSDNLIGAVLLALIIFAFYYFLS